MKRARGHQLLVEADVAYCLVIGGDYTAEHQFGVTDIQRRLSIYRGGDPLGIEDRSMTAAPHEGFVRGGSGKLIETFHQDPDGKRRRKTVTVEKLFLDPYLASHDDEWLTGYGRRWRADEDLVSSWSDRSAAIVAYGEAEKAFVRDLRAAIEAQDFACWSGSFSKNPFDASGLALAIPSRVPQELKQMMRDADEDRRRLAAAALATGIQKRVGEAPHEGSYRPRRELMASWAEGFGDLNGRAFETEHPVVFFFNAGDKGAKVGWFTVEEIDAWIEGRGPVLKEAETAGPAL